MHKPSLYNIDLVSQGNAENVSWINSGNPCTDQTGTRHFFTYCADQEIHGTFYFAYYGYFHGTYSLT